MEKREEIKSEIEQVFAQYILGQKADLSGFNKRHDGAEGDWLTKKMGLKPNGKNEPDFKGFEMKKDSAKTTFGDWSPDISLYKGHKPIIKRDDFIKVFGEKSSRVKGRYSWSGTVFPKINTVNYAGQRMYVNDTNEIIIEYSFSKDTRPNKLTLIPNEFQIETLELAKWTVPYMKNKVESKFNQLGWFKCVKNSKGVYTHLQFGFPLNFTKFIAMVRVGDIFLDCGMYVGNARPYMTWRANKNIWNQLAEK